MPNIDALVYNALVIFTVDIAASFRKERLALKRMPLYKKRIPVTELLEHPDGWLIRDVISQTGSTVLIPSGVPINKFVEGLDDPNRVIDALQRIGINTVDIALPDEFDAEAVKEQLRQLDSSITYVDNEVTQKAETVLGDIFKSASVDEKYAIPKDEIDALGASLSKAIDGVSQITLSLINGANDAYTQTHALNVSLLAGHIADCMVRAGLAKKPVVEKAVVAGLLFDIGKSAIPREIVEKEGYLTDEEMNVMRSHVHESVKMCKKSGITDVDILDGIETHHERYDGTGYYKGLVGTQIPLLGRILAVADTFDAMTSQRVYKDAVSSKLAFNFIMSANETIFDPDICRIFISGMGVYPPGSIVELSNGIVGTVVAMTPGNLLQPKISIKKGNESTIIDLTKERLFIKRSLDADPRDELDLSTL